MKKAEIIFSLLAILGIILGFFSIEGAAFLKTIAFLLLALLYYLFGFLFFNDIAIHQIFRRSAYYQTNWKRILWAIFIGQVFSIALMGILFISNQWDGVQVMFLLGTILSFVVLTISFLGYFIKKSKFHQGILIRSSIFTFIYILIILNLAF